MIKLIQSFKVAFSGIFLAIRRERNMQIHLLAVMFVSLFGWWLKINRVEWMIILICFGMVISAELFNTAIELICDKFHPEKDETIKRVKDISAGAVLVIAVVSAIIGGLILFPYIQLLFP